MLSPDALTIGFARRFATYKRANLLLKDLERLAAMVNDAKRPVQFVFAGKAHPHDEPGKTVLQQIAQMMRHPDFGDKFIFIEDYDINVARHLVQGVDVWLNNPRRPLEASGTSGMKVVLNGGLNLSVLDGWWAEAYDGLNGFAIGNGRTHSNMDVHDGRDGEALYRALLDEVIPLYYQRDRDGLPRGWINKRMKRIDSHAGDGASTPTCQVMRSTRWGAGDSQRRGVEHRAKCGRWRRGLNARLPDSPPQAHAEDVKLLVITDQGQIFVYGLRGASIRSKGLFVLPRWSDGRREVHVRG